MFPDVGESDALVEGCGPENYKEKAAAVTARWPQGFTFEEGGEVRTEDPISSLHRIAPGKEVVVVVAPEVAE